MKSKIMIHRIDLSGTAFANCKICDQEINCELLDFYSWDLDMDTNRFVSCKHCGTEYLMDIKVEFSVPTIKINLTEEE